MKIDVYWDASVSNLFSFQETSMFIDTAKSTSNVAHPIALFGDHDIPTVTPWQTKQLIALLLYFRSSNNIIETGVRNMRTYYPRQKKTLNFIQEN